MGLIEDLASKGIEQGKDLIEDKGDSTLQDVIDKGRELASDSEIDPEIAAAGNEALDKIEANKRPFVRLSAVGFAHVVGHWENDDEAEARRAYIETEATYEETRAFMQAAGDEAWSERKEREESWEEVKVVLKEIGSIGLKFLVTVLRTTLGV